MEEAKILSARDILLFNQELVGIVKSGMPLPDGLKDAARQLPRGPLRDAIEEVQTSLGSGHSLSEAVEKNRARFGDYYAALLKAGEQSGNLHGLLLQANRMARARIHFRESLSMAAIYPSVIFFFCVLLWIFIMLKVVPVIYNVYMDIQGIPPRITGVMYHFGKSLGDNPLVFLGGGAVIVVGFLLVFRSRAGQRFRESALVAIPMFRFCWIYHCTALFTRELGALLGAAVPMTEALTLVSGNMESGLIRMLAGHMRASVEKGNPACSELETIRVLPEMAVWMMKMSEERGDLPDTLLEIADLFEKRQERAWRQTVAIAEPLLIVIVGIMVAFFIISFYLPLFQLPSALI